MQHLFLVLVLMATVGCERKDASNHTDHPREQPTEVEKKPDEPTKTSEEIQLDDGKRWVANRETTDGVRRMQKQVKSVLEEKELTKEIVLPRDLF